MTQQAILKGDMDQKLASAGFIIGVLLWMISSLLTLGIVTRASNVQEELKQIGEQVVSAQASELLYALSSLGVMIGMAGVYRSIERRGAAWARLGFYIFAVGTALWIVGYSLDVAVAAAVANWQSAPATSKEAAYGVVAALSAISRGTFPIDVVVNWLAFVLLGIGMLRSAVYPRWMSWFALILGAAGVLLGAIETFAGREGTFDLFIILFALTMLWFFAIGIWIAKKAW